VATGDPIGRPYECFCFVLAPINVSPPPNGEKNKAFIKVAVKKRRKERRVAQEGFNLFINIFS